MTKRCLVTICFAVLAISTALAQENNSLPAQPQVTPAGPDLAVTMKAVEEKLRSVGPLTWTETVRAPGKPVSSFPDSEQPMSIAADPKACSLRAVYRNGGGGLTNSAVYLEEIAGVEVHTLEDSWKAIDPRVSIEPLLYSVRVGSWTPRGFTFQTKEAAEQLADLLRESIKQCSAVPVTPRAPATGSPSLAETLSFIADKLTSQGVVPSSVKLARDDGTWIMLGSGDTNIIKVSSPTTCMMRVNAIGMGPAERQLSFRRIGRIEVMKLKDYLLASWFNSQVVQGYRNIEWPPTFVLEVSAPGGDSKELYFSDETLANRVAKAMVHAAELCGAGSNEEPF